MAVFFSLRDISVLRRRSDTIIYALNNISLDIVAGTWLGIIGTNGSGKSTLARILAGLGKVSSGSVTRQSSRISIVLQNPDAQIVGQTVYEDLCFGMENACIPPEEMPHRARRALAQVGLNANFDTPIDELSGGQKQLLCVAGALVTSPDCIVFDEATAMLDPLSRHRLLGTVAELRTDGLTVVWITQWSEELTHATEVLALQDGRTVFHGSPRSFFYGGAGEVWGENEPTTATTQDASAQGEEPSLREDISPSAATSVCEAEPPGWVSAKRPGTSIGDATSPGDTAAQPQGHNSACTALGYPAPYVVQVSQHLQDLGTPLANPPMTPRELDVALRLELCSKPHHANADSLNADFSSADFPTADSLSADSPTTDSQTTAAPEVSSEDSEYRVPPRHEPTTDTVVLRDVDAIALRDINLTLQPGELTLLVGRTGAGKSTLLRSICGLAPLHNGSVEINGVSLWHKRRVQVDAIRDLTMVFQSPEQQLFASTVTKEFAYSLDPCNISPHEAQSRIGEALQVVDLPASLLEVSPKSLSGGQQRRVAIATALATKPRWLLLDEPTAGLDAPSAQTLARELRQLADTGQGIVIATHDLDVWLPLADRLIVVSEGQVAADITSDVARANPEILEQAGVGLPTAASCAAELRRMGWNVPTAVVAPAKLAHLIVKTSPTLGTAGHSEATGVGTEDKAEDKAEGKVGARPGVRADARVQAETPQSRASANGPRLRQLIQTMDARAKWLAYAVLSIVLVSMPTAGLIPSVILVGFLALACQVPWSRFWHIGRPFVLFIAFAVAFSGVTWPIGYSVQNGMQTLLSLIRILLILVLGVLFTDLTSTLEMKHGLEVALRWLKPLRIPVEAIAFGASLVLRFIPVLSAEAKKFAEVAQVRAKRVGRPGQVRLRDASKLLMPLLFSLFQLGEDLSFAMEARGLSRFGLPRTSSSTIRWRTPDTLFTMWALLLSGAVLLVAVALSKLGI